MTRRWSFAGALFIGALGLVPVLAHAQEATVSGTVTDSTGGVLPGVTVTVTHTASGNTFVAVTGGRGEFRLPVRTGTHQIILELAGFAPVIRTVDLLVGQQAVLNLRMTTATLQESVTVTAEAPLLDVTSSTLGGNVDPRQMEALPVSGRNWQELALLAPGARANAVGDSPVDRHPGSSAFQLNVDGQEVTQGINPGGSNGQPKFSRDAIAEFEFVANRFDVMQGRSTGVQINAITKSGTNTPAGTFAGYFRDDRFNAADHVARRVLPYSNQQISTTFGGPIRRDRVHVFGNFEYEREPQTVVFQTPYPHLNLSQSDARRERMGGVRVDTQFSTNSRLMVRGMLWRNALPFVGGGGGDGVASTTQTLASVTKNDRWSDQLLGTLTQVLSNRALNELTVGFARYAWQETPRVRSNWPSGLDIPPQFPVGSGSVEVRLRGLTVGAGGNTPLRFVQDRYSVRDVLTYSFAARGRHDMKMGGEYIYMPIAQMLCQTCLGRLEADIAPRPADLLSVFPNVLDATTWNLAALSPISVRYTQGVGKTQALQRRHMAALWVQDDWSITPRLTLNLGVRYDLQPKIFNQDIEIAPWVPGNRPEDLNNVAPRLGFVYSVNDRTVVRGGVGRFYGQPNLTSFLMLQKSYIILETENDGRPDFASNPFNGPLPTFDEAVARLCTVDDPFGPGCTRRSLAQRMYPPEMVLPYSDQASIGVQRQLGPWMAVTADYVWTGDRKLPVARNANLRYNPVTGVNYRFREISQRVLPNWGSVSLVYPEGRANMHALTTSFTKRFSQGWQAAATYALSGLWDSTPSTFPRVTGLPPDLAEAHGLAVTDQRHRAVLNGIWEVGGGFQLSGVYFFGSGQRFARTWGPDLRDTGGFGTNRLRPDGTIVPRNALVGSPLHRVDLRLQQQLPLWRRAKIDGTIEVFNLFNHANFGRYTTQESNPRFGQPSLSLENAYAPRRLQFGFRVAF